MRIIKYIISVILLAAMCFFIMESYAQHVLGGFEVEYATVRVTPEAQVNAKDVGEAAKRRSVGRLPDGRCVFPEDHVLLHPRDGRHIEDIFFGGARRL